MILRITNNIIMIFLFFFFFYKINAKWTKKLGYTRIIIERI